MPRPRAFCAPFRPTNGPTALRSLHEHFVGFRPRWGWTGITRGGISPQWSGEAFTARKAQAPPGGRPRGWRNDWLRHYAQQGLTARSAPGHPSAAQPIAVGGTTSRAHAGRGGSWRAAWPRPTERPAAPSGAPLASSVPLASGSATSAQAGRTRRWTPLARRDRIDPTAIGSREALRHRPKGAREPPMQRPKPILLVILLAGAMAL
jgi:hypothetical protein